MNEHTPPPGDRKRSGGRKRRPPTLPDDQMDWRRKWLRMLTLWALIVLVAYILYNYLNVTEKPEVRKSFTQYRQLIESDQIDAADIIDRELHGRLKDGTAIVVTLPFIDQQMLTEWDSLRIDYQFKEKTTNWVGQILISFLPWLLIIAFWIYLFRRMQGGAGGPKGLFSFGKSRAKLSMEGKPRITFADVAGCDEAKEELKEVIDFLRDPKKFSRLGGRIPKGALLLGPPGTGKTLLARAVAGEAEVPFFSMSGADFVEMFVGVGAARVRDLFETGKKHAPCIIFIDEIDAVGRHRGAGLGGGHDEREQTLNQLLVEMDGFESNEGVILIAATNRPDVLDPALTRPGRFDRQIVVDRPDVRGREGILKVHTKEIPLSGDVRLEVLAKGTPGLAGAELANLANEAALLAARRGAQQVSMNDFEEAKDKVMMGTERKSLLISEDEKRQTAFHEAGHVLVAKLTPGSDPVHKVTIIPRGRALGLTHYLPLDEKHNYSRTYLRLTLSHLLGGRAAEKIVFNEYSTGAGNDIERATEIARKMVCEWGMSDRLGAIALGQKQEEIFLGRELSTHRDFSERTAQEIDSEIRRIVGDAERSAEKTLRENLDKLRLVAEALLEREILDGDEIDILMKGGKLPPVNHRTVEKPAEASSRDGSGAARRERRQRRPQRPFSERRPQSSARPSGDTGESRSPRPGTPPPAGKTSDDGASRSPSQLRRDFARQHGVVSSRDPENRRPLPSEMARRRRDETPRSDSPAEASPPTAAAGEPPAATGEAAHSAERTSSRRRRSRRPRSGSRPTPSGGEGAGGSSQADTPSSGPSEPRSADSDG